MFKAELPRLINHSPGFWTWTPGFWIGTADSRTWTPGYWLWTPGFWTWTLNGMPIVTLEGDTDTSNREMLRQELLAATAYGPVVIVEIGTALCDASTMRVLDNIASMLAKDNGELRAVIGLRTVLRALAATGYDRDLRIFPSLLKALSAPRLTWQAQPQAA